MVMQAAVGDGADRTNSALRFLDDPSIGSEGIPLAMVCVLCSPAAAQWPVCGGSALHSAILHSEPLHRLHSANQLLMSEAEERGWLDGRYEDLQDRHQGTGNVIFYSRSLNVRDRRVMLESITCDQGEPDWGDDPMFMVIQVPDKPWRKIMIVDTPREFCTFRSATTCVGYKPVIADPHLCPWRMDNAMQDASAAMIREFLNVLNTEI